MVASCAYVIHCRKGKILSPYKEKKRTSSPFFLSYAISGCNMTKWSFNHDMFSKAILFSLAETGP
jgi:hypothetical protein